MKVGIEVERTVGINVGILLGALVGDIEGVSPLQIFISSVYKMII